MEDRSLGRDSELTCLLFRSRIGGTLHVRATILSAVVLSALALGGCGQRGSNDGHLIDSTPPFQYPDLSTPQNAIWNVKYAWERRDSVRTEALYDDTYQGSSTDGSGTILFTKDREIAAVAEMARDANVATVSFNLQPENPWIRLRYAGDPPGWTALLLPVGAVNILVDDVMSGTWVANSSDFFEFKFAPTLDGTSPTDTTWQIVRWTEIKN